MPSTYPGDCRRCLSELYGGMLKHMRSGRIQPSLTTPCRRRPNTFAAKNARLKTGRSAETRPKWHGANGRQCMTSVSNSSHPARCDTRPSVRLVSSNCHERRAVRARAQAWVAEGRTTGGEQSLDADHSG
ncbi:hypothetical protein PsYK624_049800 [Phanerochaete sordida]|uniref:Uncharacterized protein n=1 Tax=Phanerochaete sordida TaxID=48140 RepID=A0A9P3G4B2_9APHY|nr:hypothetical protein PsYK624_049800 [Phanerochaete sordida]